MPPDFSFPRPAQHLPLAIAVPEALNCTKFRLSLSMPRNAGAGIGPAQSAVGPGHPRVGVYPDSALDPVAGCFLAVKVASPRLVHL